MFRIAAVVLTTIAALTLACGEEEEAVPQASETPVISPSPTAARSATPSPDVVPTATPDVQPSPEVGGKAPDGCLSRELAYVDPQGRFAICYPHDAELSKGAEPPPDGYGTAVHARYPMHNDADALAVGLMWVSGNPGEKPCIPGEYIVRDERVEPFVFAGIKGTACFHDRYHPNAPETVWRRFMRVHVPFAGGGYIIAEVTYAPDFERTEVAGEAIANRFLDSVTIY